MPTSVLVAGILLALLPAQPLLHRLASQFPQSVRGDPARGARFPVSQPFSRGNRRSIQPEIPLTDIPQGPIYCLTHEVPLVLALPLNDFQEAQKFTVGSLLVPVRQVGPQRKSSAFLKLVVVPRPGDRLFPCRRAKDEQMTAC